MTGVGILQATMLLTRITFCTCLDFMHDYIVVIKKSRDSAERFYKTQVQLDATEGEEGYKEESGFIQDFPTLDEYFASLSLDDPQQFLQHQVDPVTKGIQEEFWINDSRL
jgi:hypothetical protein